MSKFNPFRPGSIIHSGMFAGRLAELATLEKTLFQTSQGNPAHFLLHGERGIGKSSLLLLIDYYAKSGIETLKLKEHFRYITVNVELERHDEQGDLINKIARELQRESNRHDELKKQLKAFWEFLTNWEVLGVKYKRGITQTEDMIEELAVTLEKFSQGVGGQWSGVYIFIDEADKPTSGAGLGSFVKILTERLTRRHINNVGIGIIGISTVIEKMKEDHESSVRILTPIHLKQLSPDDSKTVVRKGLAEAAKKNGKPTAITDEALDLIVKYSEGYPYFIQQYAFSAFDHDKDDNIDQKDVVEALTKEDGALQLLGQRYFENIYTDEIRSDDYRTVLQVIAKNMPENSTKKSITDETKLRPHTVNNAITALKKRGTVIPVSGKDGVYRLPSQSFAAWILAFKIESLTKPAHSSGHSGGEGQRP